MDVIFLGCVHFVSQCVFRARYRLTMHQEKTLSKTLFFTRQWFREQKHVAMVIQGMTTLLHKKEKEII